ncbi:MAG: hypothetical protein EOL88_00635 [Bacteroidia bacterium]|nr:hypothetical protein [Bacteroidia bacterium]
MDIKNTIKRNLFFKVDFDSKYKKSKKGIKQEVKYFLIGSVLVAVEYKNGNKERAVIYSPVEVQDDENNRVAYLRMLHGAKYQFLPTIKKEAKEKFKNLKLNFDKEAKQVLDKATNAIKKAIDKGEFRGEKIKSIYIINMDKQNYEQSKNNTKKG